MLLGAVAAVYGRCVQFDFTNYDDGDYVFENPYVLQGIGARSARWAFTTTRQANWHPLTWLSLELDASLGGTGPAVFHATNVVLHAANTLLVFLFLDRATGVRLASALVAALFAVHPLHVESVAWISERKDVLSAFFWFLALLAWVEYLRHRRFAAYAVVFLVFLFGLLAKPMVVTLPLVLLLLDVWPFGRLRAPTRDAWPLVREKAPLFVLSALSAATTIYAQHAGGALGTLQYYPLAVRVENAVVACGTYLFQTILPAHLAVLYPHPGGSLPAWKVILSATLLAGATIGALRAARRRPYLTVGWFWFVVTVLPVLGLIQAGSQARADRFTYIPLVGVFIAVAWGVRDLIVGAPARLRERLQAAAWVASIVVLVLLGGVAVVQVGTWRNGIALFEHAVAVTDPNPIAQNNLGNAYLQRNGPGDVARAMGRYAEAVRLDPRFALARSNLGYAYFRRNAPGDTDIAMEHYAEAIRLDPSYAKARNNLGESLMHLGRTEDAIALWTNATDGKPDDVDALCNLGWALIEADKTDDGIRRLEQALRVEPTAGCAHFRLGMALLKQENLPAAGEHFEAALRRDASYVNHEYYVNALLNLGVVRARQGRRDDAIRRFEEVLRLAPANELARRNLEIVSRP